MTAPTAGDRSPPDPATGRWRRLSLIATVMLLLVAVAVVARAGPYTERPPDASTAPARTSAAPQAPVPAPDPRGEQSEFFDEIPEAVDVIPANVFVVFCTLVLVALMGYASLAVLSALGLLPRSRRRLSTGEIPDTDPVRRASSEFAAAVDGAVDRVEHGEAREAVVACWLLLGRAAAEAGSSALPAETSKEYAERLCAEQLVSAGPLTKLAELYREARFSGHPVGPDLRAQARRALGVLQMELGPEERR